MQQVAPASAVSAVAERLMTTGPRHCVMHLASVRYYRGVWGGRAPTRRSRWRRHSSSSPEEPLTFCLVSGSLLVTKPSLTLESPAPCRKCPLGCRPRGADLVALPQAAKP